jgi:MFS family permease
MAMNLPEAEGAVPPEPFSAEPRPPARLFYGWIIVGLTFFTQFVVLGTVFYSYGILFKPITQDLGTSRLGVGLALPVVMSVAGLIGPFVGREVDRRSIRGLMLIGVVALSAGFLCLARVQNLWQFYLAFGGLVAVGMALLGGLPNTALVANWFIRRRGTALGISQIGVSLSGMVMAYVTTWLVGEYGWRTTANVFGIAPLVILAPLIALVVVNRPEDRGLRPDGDATHGGDGSAAQLSAAATAAAAAAAVEWPARRALRERNLWILALVVGLSFAGNSAVILQIYPHVTDLGYSATQAATVLSVMAGMTALGKPSFGWLADHASKRGAMWLTLALQILGLSLVMLAPSHLALVGAAALFGFGYGGVLPLWGVLLGAVFGRLVFGRVMGLMGPLMIPFQMFGIPFAAWVFDWTGSYQGAFATFLGLYATSAVVLCFLQLPEVEPDLALQGVPDALDASRPAPARAQ